MDIAALLIKYKADVNATDRWHFTPLHEAAQKGRTQLCALLVRTVLFFGSCQLALSLQLYYFPQVYVEIVLIFLFNVLQLAHGGDPTMRNLEGETPLDLSTVSKQISSWNLAFKFH